MRISSYQQAETSIPRDFPHRERVLAALRELFRPREGDEEKLSGVVELDLLYVGNRLTLDVSLRPPPKAKP